MTTKRADQGAVLPTQFDRGRWLRPPRRGHLAQRPLHRWTTRGRHQHIEHRPPQHIGRSMAIESLCRRVPVSQRAISQAAANGNVRHAVEPVPKLLQRTLRRRALTGGHRDSRAGATVKSQSGAPRRPTDASTILVTPPHNCLPQSGAQSNYPAKRSVAQINSWTFPASSAE